MTKTTILLRIGAIIFIIEGLIMIAFSFQDPVAFHIEAALLDAALLTLFTSPPIYFFVIKPYMEERVDMLLGLKNMFSKKSKSDSDEA